jgi:2-iminobutanoate/2-iminopropanoate deaminase
MVEYPSVTDKPTSQLPHSPAARLGELLFVSRQASVDRSGAIIRGNSEQEMRRSRENLSVVLTAAGSGLERVVSTRNDVCDAVELDTFNRIYREYFKSLNPARTTITNYLDEHLRYEGDCIAVVSPIQERSR